MKLTLEAPAKVNLGLRVGKQRPDGYHEVDTIMWAISLCDRLELVRTPESIRLSCSRPELPTDHRNTAFRAAALFFDATGLGGGVRITLEKTIPWGAGLGGGSSDGAAVLRGLNELFMAKLPKERLSHLAARIGSDAPFFLEGGCAHATGRGETLVPLSPQPLGVLVHAPPERMSTTWAYHNLKSPKLTDPGKSLTILAEKLSGGDFTGLQGLVINSFEELVFSLHPRLKKVKAFFLENGALAASLSGSGSAVFALARQDEMEKLERACRAAGIDVIGARTL